MRRRTRIHVDARRVGINEGGQIYAWSSATVVSLIVIGIVLLGVWGAYEYV